MNKMIYLDNAATTRTAPEVVEAMLPYFSELYGNASTVYEFGGKSKEAVSGRGRPLHMQSEQKTMRYILQQAGVSRITGR